MSAKTIFEKNRASGRTARMLEEARRLAELGESVLIIASSKKDELSFKRRLGPDWEDLGIRIEEVNSGNFDLWVYSGNGYERRTVLVDHYSIERRFGAVLEMLHRFDDEEEVERSLLNNLKKWTNELREKFALESKTIKIDSYWSGYTEAIIDLERWMKEEEGTES